MPRETIFQPDVSIGDLLTLARIAELFWVLEKINPAAELAKETGASQTRIRNAMMRIHAAVGPVELEGKKRRTQRPNARGRNIGIAGVIAHNIIAIARDENTDQELLRSTLNDIIVGIDQRFNSGELRKNGKK